MRKKNIEVVHYPSLMPFIIIGVIYMIGTFVLPMYKFYSYIILIALCVGIYILLRKMNVFKDQIVEIEKPIEYEYSELEEICQLGYEQVESLKTLVVSIDNVDSASRSPSCSSCRFTRTPPRRASTSCA